MHSSAGKGVCQVKPDDLSLIPRTHLKAGELTDRQSCPVTSTCTQSHIHPPPHHAHMKEKRGGEPSDLGSRVGISIEPRHPQEHVSGS